MSDQNTISMETASRIWHAHREITVARDLLADIEKAMAEGKPPTPIDISGRLRGYQLGVPSGDSGQRLFNVAPSLAKQVIEAHIAHQHQELVQLCTAARVELGIARS